MDEPPEPVVSRPTKLTPELAKTIAGHVAKGLPNAMAFRLAGVSETTFYRWKKAGERSSFSCFSHSMA